MFTAKMAQVDADNSFDDDLRREVKEAYPTTRAYIKVRYFCDSGLSQRARTDQVVDALHVRGFRVLQVKDPDSMRYAEVHFSWGDDDEE